MKLLCRLTIKKRLFIFSSLFVVFLTAGSIEVWRVFQTLSSIAADNGNVEAANSHIQKTIRSLNEYVLSEGSETPMITSLGAAEQFVQTCRLLVRTTEIPGLSEKIDQDVLAPWAEVEGLIKRFFQLGDVAVNNVEAMILLGKILSGSDLLMKELEEVRTSSVELMESEKRETMLFFAASFLLGVSLLILTQYLTYKSILHPIEKLSKFSRLIARGDLDQRIEYEAEDELSVLASSFNEMVESLSQSLVSKCFLDTVIESMMESVVFVGKDLRILKVNASTLSLLGYEEDELIGRPLHGIVNANGDRLLTTADVTKGCWESQFLAKDGKKIPIHFSSSLVYDNSDQTEKIVCVATDITPLRSVEDKLRQNEKDLNFLAHHDHLTGLPNRLLYRDRLEQAMGRARRSGQKVAVLVLDLDRFKNLNESLGHQFGDDLLCEVAERLKKLLRGTDTVARFGGDEFAFIMPEFQTDMQVLTFAEKILSSLQAPFEIHNHQIYSTASIGVSIYPDDGSSEETLLQCADAAMYQAKKQGRDNYRFYTAEMNARTHEFLTLENDLRRAVEKEQLLLHYQPQVDLASGEVVGVEALLRWAHPEKGLVSPADFIPIAEESGLIVPVGEWVLRSACQQSGVLRQLGFAQVRMAVNISARQFQDAGFLAMVKRVLVETGMDPCLLELELTESLLMDDTDNAIQVLRTLRSFGVQLAIDDFGTGFSSLSYLKLFPINRLKIDRSFVRDVTFDGNDAAIAISVMALAKSMNLEVIAEGVETEEQARFLRDNECNEGQGFLFSRPLADADLILFFEHKSKGPIRPHQVRPPQPAI